MKNSPSPSRSPSPEEELDPRWRSDGIRRAPGVPRPTSPRPARPLTGHGIIEGTTPPRGPHTTGHRRIGTSPTRQSDNTPNPVRQAGQGARSISEGNPPNMRRLDRDGWGFGWRGTDNPSIRGAPAFMRPMGQPRQQPAQYTRPGMSYRGRHVGAVDGASDSVSGNLASRVRPAASRRTSSEIPSDLPSGVPTEPPSGTPSGISSRTPSVFSDRTPSGVSSRTPSGTYSGISTGTSSPSSIGTNDVSPDTPPSATTTARYPTYDPPVTPTRPAFVPPTGLNPQFAAGPSSSLNPAAPNFTSQQGSSPLPVLPLNRRRPASPTLFEQRRSDNISVPDTRPWHARAIGRWGSADWAAAASTDYVQGLWGSAERQASVNNRNTVRNAVARIEDQLNPAQDIWALRGNSRPRSGSQANPEPQRDSFQENPGPPRDNRR